jgi:hypothetical protein
MLFAAFPACYVRRLIIEAVVDGLPHLGFPFG